MARLPFMLRSTHKREYVALGQAYRGEIAELRRRVDAAERYKRDFAASLVKRARRDMDVRDGTVRVWFDVEPMFTRHADHELPRLIAERAAVMVYRLHEDWRGDLRESDTQRILGRSDW